MRQLTTQSGTARAVASAWLRRCLMGPQCSLRLPNSLAGGDERWRGVESRGRDAAESSRRGAPGDLLIAAARNGGRKLQRLTGVYFLRSGCDRYCNASIRPGESRRSSAARLKVVDSNQMGATGERDRLRSVKGSVDAAFVDHLLAIDVEDGAVVARKGEGVSARGEGEVAPPANGEVIGPHVRTRTAGAPIEVDGGINAAEGKAIGASEIRVVVVAAGKGVAAWYWATSGGGRVQSHCRDS